MNRRLAIAATITVVLAIWSPLAFGNDPVKWSAPMGEYPTQWVPTPQPPSYYNMYGYQYPYGAYDPHGYGAFRGYYGGHYGGHYGYGAYGPQGYSGNPYYQHYGSQ